MPMCELQNWSAWAAQVKYVGLAKEHHCKTATITWMGYITKVDFDRPTPLPPHALQLTQTSVKLACPFLSKCTVSLETHTARAIYNDAANIVDKLARLERASLRGEAWGWVAQRVGGGSSCSWGEEPERDNSHHSVHRSSCIQLWITLGNYSTEGFDVEQHTNKALYWPWKHNGVITLCRQKYGKLSKTFVICVALKSKLQA